MSPSTSPSADGQVLCEVEGESVRCIGIAEPGFPFGGPMEADLAGIQVAHGPGSPHPLPGDWFRALLDGYGAEPDPAVLGFFRAYHLLSTGLRAVLDDDAGAGARAFRGAALEVEAVHALYRRRVQRAMRREREAAAPGRGRRDGRDRRGDGGAAG